MKKVWISLLIVGMTLGTAWAVRGQFGHEQGAAWAGGIGAMVLVLVSRREDWYNKILLISLSAAIGWGAGGMISYGRVVGYGRSDDFLNASYGLLMLGIIGGLFGLLGGGLLGLTLEPSKQKPVKWGNLVAEMVAGGIIFYYFLIEQLGMRMTPPRSEAWAVCLGAGVAMIWHMARNNHLSPIRVAFCTAMGAGFGFAFGNFLQILGNVLEISFNMWNVMEYSIGFFGGSAMAYGVFSAEWAEDNTLPAYWENRMAYLIVFVFIPVIVLINSPLIDMSAVEPDIRDKVPLAGNIFAILLIGLMEVISGSKILVGKRSFSRNDILTLFVLFFGVYVLLSYTVSGAFSGIFPLNHHLYVLNFAIIMILLGKHFPAWLPPVTEMNPKNGWLYVGGLFIAIIILSIVAVNIHGPISGANMRF